jgi:hypothetical protein
MSNGQVRRVCAETRKERDRLLAAVIDGWRGHYHQRIWIQVDERGRTEYCGQVHSAPTPKLPQTKEQRP